MARHYANLDWMVSHRKLDLEELTRTTEARLQGAVVRIQAEGALRDFLAAFNDPHLQLGSIASRASAIRRRRLSGGLELHRPWLPRPEL